MEHHEERIPSITSYLTGYIASLVLTLAAFGLAYMHVDSGHLRISHDILVSLIVGLASMQLVVQAVFFLHLSKHPNSRDNLVAFIVTVFMVLFIALGSLWIMNNLNYNMTPQEVGAYLHKEN